MTILLLTIGSAGDVHPFIGLGLALRQRGHRVKIITNPFFGDLTKKVGLEFVPIGSIDQFDSLRKNPDLWNSTKGFKTIADAVSGGLRETYDAVVNNYVAGETVVTASSLGWGARIAQDKHHIPTATIHLAPAVIRSLLSPPKLSTLPLPRWLPEKFWKYLYAVLDRLVIDPLVAPAINKLRAELGLPAVHHILKEWWNSPQLVIGLFPEWFGKPAGDWPSQMRLTNFPMYDEGGELSPELVEFLAAGEKPIVFTPGSAMWHAHDIFRESVEACVKINRRGILLSGHAGHIPENLPPTVRAFEYAPFSKLLPHAAALVHHGGIGTSAQAMAAGTKQIVMPFAHDQFDNGLRLQKLGVAKVINPGRYQAESISKLLSETLADVAMEARCGEIARKFVGVDPMRQTCELIESLGSNRFANRTGL
jgi:rhamnosyltransferase subunit B